MAYGSGVFVDDSTYLRGLWLVGIVSNEDIPHRRDHQRVKSLQCSEFSVTEDLTMRASDFGRE